MVNPGSVEETDCFLDIPPCCRLPPPCQRVGRREQNFHLVWLMVWSRMAGSATISPGPGGVIMESVGLKFHLIPFTTQSWASSLVGISSLLMMILILISYSNGVLAMWLMWLGNTENEPGGTEGADHWSTQGQWRRLTASSISHPSSLVPISSSQYPGI